MDWEQAYKEFAEAAEQGFPLSDLDSLADALGGVLQKHRTERPGFIHPNRVVAFAVAKLTREWEDWEWSRP